MKEVRDVQRAIEFIMSENVDEDEKPKLMQELINFSLQEKDNTNLSKILDYFGRFGEVGSVMNALIRSIISELSLVSDKATIAGFKDKIVRILENYRFQRSNLESCQKISETDTQEQTRNLYEKQRRGWRVDPLDRHRSSTECWRVFSNGTIASPGCVLETGKNLC